MNVSAIENRSHLYEIASAQGGYFTSAQALKAGYAYSQQKYHVERGTWEKIDRGIFRLRNYPFIDRPDLIRLTLWSHNQKGEVQAVASHETALEIHNLSDVMPQVIHLTVPPKFRKEPPPYVILHTSQLSEKEIEWRDGYYVTRPLRTLLDAAESALSQEHLNKAVNDALAQGMIRKSILKSIQCSPKTKSRLDQALKSELE
jgi:predicted transcriptional regulator of viral defense system